MSLIGRLNLGRRFSTAVPKRAEDIMSNPDCRPTQLLLRVSYLIRYIGDLDTAAKYARLAVFSKINSESTETTCQSIIRGMLLDKRSHEAIELYGFFFSEHKCRPNVHCRNNFFETFLQRGFYGVDEVLRRHNEAVESVKAHDYPNTDSFRVLTKGLVHSGRLDLAEPLLQPWSWINRYPDHVAFNNLIRGFLDLGNLDKANLLLAEFKRLFYVALSVKKEDDLNRSNYDNKMAFLMATFMEYWFKQGKEVEAMECYNCAVLSNRLPVCAETGNSLLVVLLKYGEKDHAWALYHDLLDRNGIDSDTVKIMVGECFDTGRFSEAMETYNKARTKNHFLSGPEDSFFFAVKGYIITRCCENGLLSEAESVFVDPLADDLGYIDVNTFKTMIDAYVKAAKIDDAVKTSNKMIDATLKEVSDLF